MHKITTLSAILSLGLRDDLKGPRTRGSLTEIGLESLSDRHITEFRPEIGNVSAARYFRVEAEELQGRLGAVQLSDLNLEQQKLLRTRFVENHGVEFFLDITPDAADLPSVGHATVILGPVDEQGTLGFWTWFPGDVVGTAIAQGAFSDHPIRTVGVKLHNGQ